MSELSVHLPARPCWSAVVDVDRLFSSLFGFVLCIMRYPRSSLARRTSVVVRSCCRCCSLRSFLHLVDVVDE